MKLTIANFKYICNTLASNIKSIEQISESFDAQIDILKASLNTEKDKETINALFEEKRRFTKVYASLESILIHGNVLLELMVKWDSSEEPSAFDASRRQAYQKEQKQHFDTCLPKEIDVDDLPKTLNYLESLLDILKCATKEKLLHTIAGQSQAEIFINDIKAVLAARVTALVIKNDEPTLESTANLRMFKAAPAEASSSVSASKASMPVSPQK